MPELGFPVPPLTDEAVLLRPWRATDLPARLMLFADPDVHRFAWVRTAPVTEADAHAAFAGEERARRRGEHLAFAVVERDDDEAVLGGASLHHVDLGQGRAA